MWEIVGRALTLPFLAMLYGVDATLRALGEFRQLAAGSLESLGVDGQSLERHETADRASLPPPVFKQEETPVMADTYYGRDDRDTGGDDLKVIKYRAHSDEYDDEKLLVNEEFLITEARTEAEIGVAIMKDITARAKTDPLAQEAVDLSKDKKRNKYLRITFHVGDRWPRRDPNFDEKTADRLKDINYTGQDINRTLEKLVDCCEDRGLPPGGGAQGGSTSTGSSTGESTSSSSGSSTRSRGGATT
jgi:hypothetical protein